MDRIARLYLFEAKPGLCVFTGLTLEKNIPTTPHGVVGVSRRSVNSQSAGFQNARLTTSIRIEVEWPLTVHGDLRMNAALAGPEWNH